MFYFYFRGFSIICSIFGLSKPLVSSQPDYNPSIFSWRTLWSLVVVASLIIFSVFQMKIDMNSIVDSIHSEISYTNNVIVSVIIILNNITNWEKIYRMYDVFDKVNRELKLRPNSIKMMSLKLYVWFFIELSLLSIFAILEITYVVQPYVIIIRIPVFLSIFHLIVHLSLMLSVLKVINFNMLELLKKNSTDDVVIYSYETTTGAVSYIFNYNIYFPYVKSDIVIDLKILCKIYDDLCSCLQLLEKCHGVDFIYCSIYEHILKVLLTIWLMFTNAVAAVTIITKNETTEPSLEIIKAVEVILWFCVGCFIDEQMTQEVEYTQLLVIKNLINFKCDKNRKEVLNTFNTVINSNRLQFRACNLYRMNYGTILGTVVSVITYSIIAVQLL
ncbi:uncharacterized protein LOC116769245 [Danaus plexippus]|uniref:uncharacterized protein LOC116769245 n=1 Tax=Danaus plexippus TaxID=13037 RepID=UPI002AB167C0|nr:uncharacterized protein LOC116769245 [Danaus plexippus]